MSGPLISPAPIEALPVAEIRISQQRHLTWLFVFCAVLTASFVLSVKDRDSVGILGLTLPEVCTLKRCTGMDCPGCGLTRSFISMAHAEWARARRFHPAGPVWFIVFAMQIPYRIVQVIRLRNGKPEIRTGYEWHFVAGLVGALLAGWIYRMMAG